MRHDTIASFLQKIFFAEIVTYGSLASRWRTVQVKADSIASDWRGWDKRTTRLLLLDLVCGLTVTLYVDERSTV